MRLDTYLGKSIGELLESDPFKNWPVKKSVEDELSERISHYIFDGNGLELRCDSHENVSAIFLHSSNYGGFDESLSEIPFTQSRNQVLTQFGPAEKSGDSFRDSILGDCGAWDRFALPTGVIHFEYKFDADEVYKITLMRRDTTPT